MSRRSEPDSEVTAQLLLRAYAIGIFPMAESADDPTIYWVEPKERGIFPLDSLAISSRLARTVRSDHFEVRVDTDFDAVIDGCAAPGAGREHTWINARIRGLYGELFDMGHVHTIEAWREGKLVGGLYGVTLGAAFFGESMFHIERDASKVALVHLVARLRLGSFRLLDTQFVTPHLESLGAVSIPRRRYRELLDGAVAAVGDFDAWPKDKQMPGVVAVAAARGQNPSSV
ncbi:MAG: leucyl/phenylalanyl-tRNA--protein transferase [Alsobacter sp.]